MTKDYPWGKGTPKWVRDATANDSDKSWTVPVGKMWKLLYVNVEYVCTATVGNRTVRVSIGNGTNNVNCLFPVPNLTASQYGSAEWAINNPVVSTTLVPLNVSTLTPANAGVQAYIPDLILPAGYTITAKDTAAIDAAADDMTVILHYIEYDA